MALITQGNSNAEIAALTYLSINSVKTHIRNAYRKIGVTQPHPGRPVGRRPRLQGRRAQPRPLAGLRPSETSSRDAGVAAVPAAAGLDAAAGRVRRRGSSRRNGKFTGRRLRSSDRGDRRRTRSGRPAPPAVAASVRRRVLDAPTSTEIGVVAKSGLAAGLSWWVAGAITDVTTPVLAPLTAIVVVQVSVRASVRTAIQRERGRRARRAARRGDR